MQDPTLAQQPDHISISYCPIDSKNNAEDFKYWNVMEDIPTCRFPSLKLKIYAELKVPDAKTNEAIRKCIIKRCKEMHIALEQTETTHSQDTKTLSWGQKGDDR